MLLPADTISNATGISIETIYGLIGTALALIGLQVANERRRSKQIEDTYVRKDVYREQQKPLIKQVNRIEAMVELIYRHMRGLPPRKNGPDPEVEGDENGNGL